MDKKKWKDFLSNPVEPMKKALDQEIERDGKKKAWIRFFVWIIISFAFFSLIKFASLDANYCNVGIAESREQLIGNKTTNYWEAMDYATDIIESQRQLGFINQSNDIVFFDYGQKLIIDCKYDFKRWFDERLKNGKFFIEYYRRLLHS